MTDAIPTRVRGLKVFRGAWAWRPFIYTWTFPSVVDTWMFRTLFIGPLRVQWTNPEVLRDGRD
jgi:hypothetical protein